jgi:transcriptional regulator with XRE-family HTH domain
MPTKRPGRRGTGTRRVEAAAAARLDRACAHLAFAEIARLVRMNHETVRRQLLGQGSLSVELLARLCLALGLSADAVLFGGGRWAGRRSVTAAWPGTARSRRRRPAR